jgi:hypothetical protein
MLQKLKAWPQQDISLIVVGAASVDWLECAAYWGELGAAEGAKCCWVLGCCTDVL